MPANLHHLRTGKGMGQRGEKCIPLCPDHHQEGPTAFHRGRKTFERNHGTELELWEQVLRLLD